MSFQANKKNPPNSQMELAIEMPLEPDRNHARGGRSFYFFDFDDNVLFLPTQLFLFHKDTGREKAVTTREFAAIGHLIGQSASEPWNKYEIRLDPQTGSFRRFRQKQIGILQKIFGARQPLVEDLVRVLKQSPMDWRGPSWNFFWHAVHNGRPLSIITARGHHPETFQEAIGLLTKHGHLSRKPNYLSVFPVSHHEVRRQLGDKDCDWHTARLKQEAIKYSVEEAFRVYGYNPGHRFGMSDDDPVNIKLIVEALQSLKRKYPANSFFIIDTHSGLLSKQEIFADSVQSGEVLTGAQLNLFND